MDSVRDAEHMLNTRIRSYYLIALLALSVLLGQTVRAQEGRLSRLHVVLWDSLSARPLHGATVFLARLQPSPTEDREASSAPDGSANFADLRPGRYSVGVLHPLLDSLGIAIPVQSVDVYGADISVHLGIPSATVLRRVLCSLGKDQGEIAAVVGRVRDARAGAPLRGAIVVVEWRVLLVDAVSKGVSSVTRRDSVLAGSDGRYTLCSAPSDEYVRISTRFGTIQSPALQIVIPSQRGTAVQDFDLDTGTALRRDATERQASSPTEARSPKQTDRRGDVSAEQFSGVVRTASGRPVQRADVIVLGSPVTARTDSLGRFRLFGAPLGTQIVRIRALGYLARDAIVTFRPGNEESLELRLESIALLDSVRVVALRSPYPAFETHRKRTMGRYFDEEALAKQVAVLASDFVRVIPGFMVVGSGYGAQLRMRTRGSTCPVNVYVDGIRHSRINEIHADEIGAMEVYRQQDDIPPEYQTSGDVGGAKCGAVVIWRKKRGE